MKKLTSTIALLSASLASACCLLPLFFGGVAGIAIFASFFAKLRPILLLIMFACLGYGFYVVYFKKSQACGEGEICATARGRKRQKLLLWLVTVVVIVVATFPTWIQWF